MNQKSKNIGLSGVGNDFKHQLIISHILYELMVKCKMKTYKNYVPFPEFSIKHNSKDYVPDLSVWEVKQQKLLHPIIVIEVCWPHQIKDEIDKINKMFTNRLSITEGFIIDKENLTIKRIERTLIGKISTPKDISQSHILKLDLAKVMNSVPDFTL